MTEISLLPAALRIAASRGMTMPDGLSYGLRAVRPDFTSSHGYRWQFPGQWAEASGPFSAGLTWEGIASDGIPAHTVLLVGWRADDVLGRDDRKLRARRMYVADVISFATLLDHRAPDEPLNLCGIDLRGPAYPGPTSAGPTSTRPTSKRPASAGPPSAGPASTRPTSAGPTSAGLTPRRNAPAYSAGASRDTESRPPLLTNTSTW